MSTPTPSWASVALTRTVDPAHVDSLLALFCGYFLQRRDEPTPALLAVAARAPVLVRRGDLGLAGEAPGLGVTAARAVGVRQPYGAVPGPGPVVGRGHARLPRRGGSRAGRRNVPRLCHPAALRRRDPGLRQGRRARAERDDAGPVPARGRGARPPRRRPVVGTAARDVRRAGGLGRAAARRRRGQAPGPRRRGRGGARARRRGGPRSTGWPAGCRRRGAAAAAHRSVGRFESMWPHLDDVPDDAAAGLGARRSERDARPCDRAARGSRRRPRRELRHPQRQPPAPSDGAVVFVDWGMARVGAGMAGPAGRAPGVGRPTRVRRARAELPCARAPGGRPGDDVRVPARRVAGIPPPQRPQRAAGSGGVPGPGVGRRFLARPAVGSG